MRRYTYWIVVCLVATGIGCNLGASPTPTPRPSPSQIPDLLETELPPIEAASTAVAQYSATLTAEAPPTTPTPAPETGTICLLAFEDRNGNALRDATEAVVQDVRFVLQHETAQIETLLRASDRGSLCLAEMPPGEYRISAVPPVSAGSAPAEERSISLAAGQTAQVSIGFVEASRPDGRLVLAEGQPRVATLVGDASGSALYLVSGEALYKSADGGQRWEAAGELPPAAYLVVSPADPNYLYAGGHLECFRGGPPESIYISSDGGASWAEAPGATGLRPAAAHPDDPSVAWAVGCDGPYLTQDGGLTWQLGPADEWGLYILDEIQPVTNQPRILYASGNSEGGSGALFRSPDGGRSWRMVTDEPELWISALLARPDNADELWFATPAGIWHTLDGGGTWEVSRSGLEDVTVGDDYLFESKGLHSLARASSGTLYLGTERGVFQSSDGGVDWRSISGPPWAGERIGRILVSDVWPETRLWVLASSGVYLFTPR